MSSFTEYHFIEEFLIKADLLGHSDPTMLKELQELTKFEFDRIKMNNKEIYEALLNPEKLNIPKEKLNYYCFPSCTTGISEMNTDFTMNIIKELKPKNFFDMICFSGLTHGTSVFHGNRQRELLLSGEKTLKEVIPYRDIIFQQLTKKYGFEPETAFKVSESVRKGKGIQKWQTELEEKCPSWYIDIMKKIKYLFPKMHAFSYVLNSLRTFYYKIYHPQAFYTAALNRYGITNTSNNTFDYLGFYEKTNTPEDLYRYHAYVRHSTDNAAKEKANIHIGNIVYEMKLRGFEIKPPEFSSKALECTPSKKNKKVILMPLASIAGVGSETAKLVELGYKTYGDSLYNMTREELFELKVEKDGKEVKAFGKKFLDGYFGKVD
ncbi:hypothetical protein [Fusobacterium necrophorum]|uniref:hypothetical protein n=1 Tax=Fusobacterium necrophorum TaxID=859 RepID=UPI00164ED391|nr:hypothetical protein [Fusobacterium necrophorum]